MAVYTITFLPFFPLISQITTLSCFGSMCNLWFAHINNSATLSIPSPSGAMDSPCHPAGWAACWAMMDEAVESGGAVLGDRIS